MSHVAALELSDADCELRCLRLLDKLAIARRRKLQTHGADRHGWRMEPVLSAKELRDFEQSAGVRLPAQYRYFIQRIGRAGAGPGVEGLFGLERAFGFDAYAPRRELLSLPFPQVQGGNPEDQRPTPWDCVDSGEISEDEAERQIGLQIAGSMALAHDGCGIVHLLVVAGAARGTTWLDLRIDGQGLWPHGVGFFDWYEAWIDHALAEYTKSSFWFKDLAATAC